MNQTGGKARRAGEFDNRKGQYHWPARCGCSVGGATEPVRLQPLQRKANRSGARILLLIEDLCGRIAFCSKTNVRASDKLEKKAAAFNSLKAATFIFPKSEIKPSAVIDKVNLVTWQCTQIAEGLMSTLTRSRKNGHTFGRSFNRRPCQQVFTF